MKNFLIFILFVATVSAFDLTEPKWPNDTNAYELPVTGETVHELRFAVGSSSVGDQIVRWAIIFQSISDVKFLVNFVYYNIGFDFNLDLDYLSINRNEAFISIETFMNETQAESHKNITQVPTMIQPLVFSYNIPGWYPFVTYRPNDTIIMDVELLADIYMGLVTNWNDTRIRELNPMKAALLPNATIYPMGYLSRQPLTIYITQVFWDQSKRFREAFPEGPFSFWPTNSSFVNKNMVFGDSPFGPVTAVNDFPGALGYVTLSISNAASGQTRPYIQVFHQGETRFPDDESSVMKIYEHAKLGKNNVLKNINYSAPGYPFSTVTYFLFTYGQESIEFMCTQDRATLKLFKWAFESKDARDTARPYGFYYVPDKIMEKVVKIIMGFECYEQGTLLQQEIINDHESYFTPMFIVAMIIGFITVFMGVFLIFMKPSKNAKWNLISILYNVCLLAGASIALLSMIFFYLVPTDDWICQLRIWPLGIGYSMFFGAMFTRTMQMYRMYKLTGRDDIPRGGVNQRSRALLDFVFGFVLVTVLQIVLLTCWSIIDKLSAELSVISDVNLTSSWVCKSDSTWVWLGIEIGFFSCLFAYGLIVCYLTWDVDSKFRGNFTESKWNLMIIYNMIITGVAVIPVVLTVEIKDKQLFIIAIVCITFNIGSSIILFHIPKIGAPLERGLMRFRHRLPGRDTTSSGSPHGTTHGVSGANTAGTTSVSGSSGGDSKA